MSRSSNRLISAGFCLVLIVFRRVSGVESSLRASRCKQIVESLPEHNFIVVRFLLGFLHEVGLRRDGHMIRLFYETSENYDL